MSVNQTHKPQRNTAERAAMLSLRRSNQLRCDVRATIRWKDFKQKAADQAAKAAAATKAFWFGIN